MSEWRCGKCAKEYTFEEFMDLPHIQAVEEDDNPKEQHGFVSICVKCGYVFHKDKMKLRETIEIEFGAKNFKVDVSTVFLEMSYDEYWYETMIFGDEIHCDYQERYKTMEEAKDNHIKLIAKLKNKDFEINPTEYTLFVNTKDEVKEK